MSTPARIFSTMFSFVFTGNQHEALHIIRRFNVKTFFNVEFEHFGWENNFSPIILIFLYQITAAWCTAQRTSEELHASFNILQLLQVGPFSPSHRHQTYKGCLTMFEE